MSMNVLQAAQAYGQSNKLKLGAEATDESDGGSFAQMVQDATHDAAQTLKNSEATKMEALTTNNVDLSDLVTAVSNAELMLSTVVAVRDRVISAYQDIIRMPI